MHKNYGLFLCISILALAGCGNNKPVTDAQEERDPMVKTGLSYMEQGQWDEAEKAFKEALENEPLMAKPHLELALIYQQHKPNYVHAIYHFDRYLELRPDSEKASLIMDQRDKVMRALAVQAIQQSPDVQRVVAEAQRLQRENATLKAQLADGQSAAPKTTMAPAPPTSSTATDTAATPSAKPATGHQIYTVQAQDTLTKISTKFYGDSSNWDVIYNANRDSLSSPNALRVGQTLVIPNVGN